MISMFDNFELIRFALSRKVERGLLLFMFEISFRKLERKMLSARSLTKPKCLDGLLALR